MLTYSDKERIISLHKKHFIYSTWSDGDLFQKIIDSLAEPFEQLHITKVVGVEARGFVLGAAVAYKLHAGFVVIRKGGQMYKEGYTQDDVFVEECIDYSGKRKLLELEKHEKSIQPKDTVLLVDDWFERGGQGHAAIRLVERAGGDIVGIGVVLDEMTDEIRRSFDQYNFHALLKYASK